MKALRMVVPSIVALALISSAGCSAFGTSPAAFYRRFCSRDSSVEIGRLVRRVVSILIEPVRRLAFWRRHFVRWDAVRNDERRRRQKSPMFVRRGLRHRGCRQRAHRVFVYRRFEKQSAAKRRSRSVGRLDAVSRKSLRPHERRWRCRHVQRMHESIQLVRVRNGVCDRLCRQRARDPSLSQRA